MYNGACKDGTGLVAVRVVLGSSHMVVCFVAVLPHFGSLCQHSVVSKHTFSQPVSFAGHAA